MSVIGASGVHALTLDAAQVASFIDFMAEKHGFDKAELAAIFNRAKGHEKIIEAMTRPAEGKQWFEYRPIFITDKRIDGGVQFLREHEELLHRAEQQYGVPAEIIVAIIGVETFYGRVTGSYPVLEAVSTLAFHYPKRAAFFRGELEQFLLLAREEHVDPLSLTGSYAGAMGMPQFISSSYRHYAVDFDGDGKRNIWNDVDDVVGSVANYLSENGWRRGQGVVIAARNGRDTDVLDKWAGAGVRPSVAVTEVKATGVVDTAALSDVDKVSVIRLQQKLAPEYWLGLNNFYVITRYNTSPLYAMAVYQLAEQIRAKAAL